MRNPFSISLLSFLGCVFFMPALTTLAQNSIAPGTIRGTVLDTNTNEALVNAEIRLFRSGIEVRAIDAPGAVTAANGTFDFKNIAPAAYALEARMLGYETARKSVVIVEGQIAVVVFTLKQVTLELNEALVESASMVGTAAIRMDIPGSVYVLSSRTLEKFQYADVHRILRQIPGINITEEDGYGLRPNIGMRGTGSERSSKITVMEDGILIAPAPYAAPAAYYFPTVGRAAGIEVRKGSSQIMYGPYTTGGAINLLSRPIPTTFSGMLSTTLGTNAARIIHGYAGSSWKNVGFVVETYQSQTDGFKRLDGFGGANGAVIGAGVGGGDGSNGAGSGGSANGGVNGTGTISVNGNTGFDKKDYLAKLRINTNPSASIYQSLEFKVSRTDEISNETYLGLTDFDFALSPSRRYSGSGEDVLNALHKQWSVTHTIRPFRTAKITTSAYHITFHRNWYKLNKVARTADATAVGISDILRDAEAYSDEFAVLTGASRDGNNRLEVKANNRDYLSRGIQTNAVLVFDGLGGNHRLNIGGRVHYDEMDRFQWVDTFKMTETGMQLSSEGVPGTDSNRIESAKALSLYFQQEAEFGRFKVLPGLRYERITQSREDYGKTDPGRTGEFLNVRSNTIDVLIPGFGISGRVNNATLLFAGIHKGFSPPGSREGTDPESSVNYEAGIRHNASLFSAELTAFVSDYSNLLGTDLAASGGTGSGDLFNGGEVDVSGLELAASYNLGKITSWRLSIPISLTYTYTSAIFRNSFDSSYEPWGAVEAGDHLPYIPANQLSFGFGLEGRGFDLELGSSFVSEMRTQAGQGDIPANQRTDAHLVLDISGGVEVSQNVRLFASLRNVTDAVYIVARRPAGLRPGLPRTMLFGATARF